MQSKFLLNDGINFLKAKTRQNSGNKNENDNNYHKIFDKKQKFRERIRLGLKNIKIQIGQQSPGGLSNIDISYNTQNIFP